MVTGFDLFLFHGPNGTLVHDVAGGFIAWYGIMVGAVMRVQCPEIVNIPTRMDRANGIVAQRPNEDCFVYSAFL